MQIPFLKSISFTPIDPIDNGLREEIIAEQQEDEAITLEEGLGEGQSEAFWQSVEEDIHKDPEWFTFDNE